MILTFRRALGLSCSIVLGWACSAPDLGNSRDEDEGGGSGDGDATSAGGLPSIDISDDAGPGGAPSGEPVVIVRTLPPDFSAADLANPTTSKGGYRVLGPLADVPAPDGECGNILRVILRDFQASHDDFENAADWSLYQVQSPIDASRKPVKTSENGPLHLDEWYKNLPEVNQPFAVDLWLEPVGETFVFDSAAFFPLQNWGYKDNYLFTTELHTNFEYQGGELFTFRGDDDVFVFVNGHLAVNLSGVHDAQVGSIELDAQASTFGLELGKSYTFDLFQAERQPGGSNFRVETTLSFTGCGTILPADVVR